MGDLFTNTKHDIWLPGLLSWKFIVLHTILFMLLGVEGMSSLRDMTVN